MVGSWALVVSLAAVLPLVSSNARQPPKNTMVVATYNLWNIMFNWEIRKLRISQLLKESGADIVGLQEVRADHRGVRSQVAELHALLPQFLYAHFEIATNVTQPKGTYLAGWEHEGLGLLSCHKILHARAHHLSYHQGPDSNRRIILHATIEIPSVGIVNIIVVHFSYDRIQQCENALEVLHFIEGNKLQNVIVIGDFNTYVDYEGPIQILTGETANLKNRCPMQYRQPHLLGNADTNLVDSWKTAHPLEIGFSFSNMPVPGLESRPDRILICERFQVVSAELLGKGSVYKERYFYHVWWNRFDNFIAAAFAAYEGKKGRSCQYDCGPHASCRCGMCVSGGDESKCHLPDCAECRPTTLIYIIIAVLTLLALVMQLVYALTQVLHAMNHRSSQAFSPFFAVNCCLCNPRLYALPSSTRRCRRSLLMRTWPCLRLPPVFLTVVSVLLGFLWLEIVLFVFRDAIHDINSILPEELYPSDHLLLVAHVGLHSMH